MAAAFHTVALALVALLAALAAELPAAAEGSGHSLHLQTVYFDPDSTLLTPAARDILKRHAGMMRRNPELSFAIEGHTDEKCSEEYCLALGETLASRALNFLVSQGVSPARLTALSHGKSCPLDPGHDQAGLGAERAGGVSCGATTRGR